MPTTIKAALKKWEEASGKKSAEAKEIKLIGDLFFKSKYFITYMYDQTYQCLDLNTLHKQKS